MAFKLEWRLAIRVTFVVRFFRIELVGYGSKVSSFAIETPFTSSQNRKHL